MFSCELEGRCRFSVSILLRGLLENAKHAIAHIIRARNGPPWPQQINKLEIIGRQKVGRYVITYLGRHIVFRHVDE